MEYLYEIIRSIIHIFMKTFDESH